MGAAVVPLDFTSEISTHEVEVILFFSIRFVKGKDGSGRDWMKIIGPDRTVDNCIIAQGIQVEGVFTRKICAFNRKFRGFWCIATST